eukprot:2821904-Pleurochrysis_carterae.AAC.3
MAAMRTGAFGSTPAGFSSAARTITPVNQNDAKPATAACCGCCLRPLVQGEELRAEHGCPTLGNHAG